MSATQSNARTLLSIQERIESLDWPGVLASLEGSGWARLPTLLTAEECAELSALYQDDRHFRSRINMERYRFGRGEYKYFAYPLPSPVAELRRVLYPHLASIANQWAESLEGKRPFPATHEEFIKLCHSKGQTRPTPLMLHYESGDYNCLHQDLYGEIYFPFQTVFLLSERGRDFEGGEFVLVEQRPRAQSAAQVISPELGQAVIFTTRWRPVRGTRGHYRVNMKHGVSPVTRGIRNTLGIVYHDAE